jgi:Ricin-type beta-trefoil lectin domain
MKWRKAVTAAATAFAATLGVVGTTGLAAASAGHPAPHSAIRRASGTTHQAPSLRGITLHPVAIKRHGAPEITVPRSKVGHHVNPLGGGNLLYHGGPVQGDPEVYLLFWGSWWNSGCTNTQGNGGADETYLYDYYHGMGSSADNVSPIASQYGDSSGTHPTFPTAAGQAFITWNADCTDPPQSASDAQLAAEAASYASYLRSAGYPIDNNTQIVVISPSGTNPGGGFGSQYCAYHNWTQMSDGTFLSWTNLPYIPDAGGNCGANIIQNGFDGWSIVGGHEYMESTTDPFVNSPSPGSAWYDDQGYEIGDKCAWTNLFTETLGSWGTFAQQPEWDNSTGSCQPVDTISVTGPGNQTTTAGTGVSLQIHGSSHEGNPLTFTASGLPAGLSISASGLISGTPTTPGVSSVRVTATDTTPSVSGLATFTWTVKPAAVTGPIKVVGGNYKCLDDYLSHTYNGADVDLWQCLGTGRQQWTAAAGNTLTVFGKCLTNQGGINSNGNEIVISACTGSGTQKWVHQSNGSYLNPATGKCLNDHASGTANGTEIELWRCNGASAEDWVGP